MSEKTVTFKIDGVEIQGKGGQTILEAAEEAGSHVKEVSRGAALGTREGIMTIAKAAREALSTTGDRTKTFVWENSLV